jgi:hypothetical protein
MKKICIACPFCHPEFKLRKELKVDYFISAPGGKLHFELAELEALKLMIEERNIDEIIILDEPVDCPFKTFQENRFEHYFINEQGELKGLKSNKELSLFDFFKTHPVTIATHFQRPVQNR